MGGLGPGRDDLERRLALIRQLVARPFPTVDPVPAFVGESLFVGSRHHAADVEQLASLGVTALLNCAPGGIRLLPCRAYEERGIRYGFTNVKRDDSKYPLLHGQDGVHSKHLEEARAFYEREQERGGKVLFFCIAGQNRSAALAVAVLMLRGQSLEELLGRCAEGRPFVLENEGFQRQLVELEASLRRRRAEVELQDGTGSRGQKRPPAADGCAADKGPHARRRLHTSHDIEPCSHTGQTEPCSDDCTVLAELYVPGLYRVFDVAMPAAATPAAAKKAFVDRVNVHLLSESSAVVGKAWLVYRGSSATGCEGDGPLDLILEEEAVESGLQLLQLQHTFGLEIAAGDPDTGPTVRWTDRCQFELVIFSVVRSDSASQDPMHEPFTFVHRERQGAPGTLLASNGVDTCLRAWDFGSGAGFRSARPMVFSFSVDPRNKRDFREVSTSASGRCQSFSVPEEASEGSILGMGANAIVHRAHLETSGGTPDLSSLAAQLGTARPLARRVSVSDLAIARAWDAAVKRPFSLGKMLAFMDDKSEAGMAKRLRMAGALNKHGRLLYFYGLGIALASNCDNRGEYKFETVLLSRYEEEFSTYTLKKFLEDYTADVSSGAIPDERLAEVRKLQQRFSLIKVKVLLVSLLNGFRNLTLMGIQAFDFNHLNNVLISRDYVKARIIDIDGENKGSIQFPSEYIQGSTASTCDLHMPALDIDLSTLLPVVVSQLICGKGRGPHFVDRKVSEIKRATSDEYAKAVIRGVIQENFFAEHPAALPETGCDTSKHLHKVVEWFHALLLKKRPWTNWTNDIYDAMRCIDHLPIS